MNKTKIEWCDISWNVVTGCLHGCKYCYAAGIANRFSGKWTVDKGICIMYHGYPELTEQLQREINGKSIKVSYPFGFFPTFNRYRLDEPKNKTKPLKIFVSSMGDLFGDWVPDEWIQEVLKTVRECPQHSFLFLTKNPKRYREINFPDNAWIGTSVENQAAADLRIPLLLEAKAKVKFVSVEPLLGPLDLSKWINAAWWAEKEQVEMVDGLSGRVIGTRPGHTGWHHVSGGRYGLSWVIIGGETGHGAKPVNPEWAGNLIQQLRAAKVATFLKDNLHWPEQIQEWPV